MITAEYILFVCRVKPDQRGKKLQSDAPRRCCRLPRRRAHSTLPVLWSGLLTSHKWMRGLVGVLLEGDVSPWQLASSSSTTEWSCQDSGSFSLLSHHHSDLVWLSPWLNPIYCCFSSTCFWFIFLMWLTCPCGFSLLYFFCYISIHANSTSI